MATSASVIICIAPVFEHRSISDRNLNTEENEEEMKEKEKDNNASNFIIGGLTNISLVSIEHNNVKPKIQITNLFENQNDHWSSDIIHVTQDSESITLFIFQNICMINLSFKKKYNRNIKIIRIP